MMSFILLMIAGVVVYYLYTTFEEYLKNPLPSTQKPQEKQDYPPKDNPYSLPTPQDKLKNSYAGATVAMLNILLQAGISQKNPSLLQIILLDNFIKNLHLQESQETLLKQMLNGIDFSQIISKKSTAQTPTSTDSKEADTPISTLAQIFLDNTYGEYKKRLHFVGFALTLAWSDRVLEEKEREIILDIAAFLQLENDEFNELYDSFENRFGTETSETDKANEADTSLVEQYKKELEAKQEQSSLQEAYQSIIQKLCSKSQAASEPQAELLVKLLALESAYNAKNA